MLFQESKRTNTFTNVPRLLVFATNNIMLSSYTYTVLEEIVILYMNIHPLLVHFPIGILVLYTAFEILRFSFIVKRPAYFEIKAILIILGTISAYLTFSTGEIAEELIQVTDPTKMPLVEIHSMYAGATVVIFSILAGTYLVEWCRRNNFLSFITKIGIIQKLTRFILRFSPLLAILGLITITITGGLGAAIVYGPDVDPFVNFIYKIFITTLE